MSLPECGLCDGMRICSCKSEPIDKRFIAACYAMQGFLAAQPSWAIANCNPGTWQENIKLAVEAADALIAELEKK